MLRLRGDDDTKVVNVDWIRRRLDGEDEERESCFLVRALALFVFDGDDDGDAVVSLVGVPGCAILSMISLSRLSLLLLLL